jgi:hypothetical protein
MIISFVTLVAFLAFTMLAVQGENGARNGKLCEANQ